MPNVANEVVFTGIVLFNAKLGFFFSGFVFAVLTNFAMISFANNIYY